MLRQFLNSAGRFRKRGRNAGWLAGSYTTEDVGAAEQQVEIRTRQLPLSALRRGKHILHCVGQAHGGIQSHDAGGSLE